MQNIQEKTIKEVELIMERDKFFSPDRSDKVWVNR